MPLDQLMNVAGVGFFFDGVDEDQLSSFASYNLMLATNVFTIVIGDKKQLVLAFAKIDDELGL
jgi:hypothetical protein